MLVLRGRETDTDIDLLVAFPLQPARGLDDRFQEGSENIGGDERPTIPSAQVIICGVERAARGSSRSRHRELLHE